MESEELLETMESEELLETTESEENMDLVKAVDNSEENVMKYDLNSCFEAIGQTPIKSKSKLTPSYVKEKVAKVSKAVKRKLANLYGSQESLEVSLSIIIQI